MLVSVLLKNEATQERGTWNTGRSRKLIFEAALRKLGEEAHLHGIWHTAFTGTQRVPGTPLRYRLGTLYGLSWCAQYSQEKECRSCGLCKPKDTCTTSVLLAKNQELLGFML